MLKGLPLHKVFWARTVSCMAVCASRPSAVEASVGEQMQSNASGQ